MNSSSRGSPDVNRSTSSPPSQRNRPMVTLSAERAITSHTAPESCQRCSSAVRSMCIPLRFHPMSARRRIKVARVYDDATLDDGERILVDRLWPRGFRKGDPRVGRWIPKVAPSTELRKWYSHEPARFDEFAARYTAELETAAGAAALVELRDVLKAGPITLVT